MQKADTGVWDPSTFKLIRIHPRICVKEKCLSTEVLYLQTSKASVPLPKQMATQLSHVNPKQLYLAHIIGHVGTDCQSSTDMILRCDLAFVK
jgi:hypothetical protein